MFIGLTVGNIIACLKYSSERTVKTQSEKSACSLFGISHLIVAESGAMPGSNGIDAEALLIACCIRDEDEAMYEPIDDIVEHLTLAAEHLTQARAIAGRRADGSRPGPQHQRAAERSDRLHTAIELIGSEYNLLQRELARTAVNAE